MGVFVLLLVWYDFGTAAPQTQSLYSKLIGKGNAGLYFAVLQSNGAVGHIVSGQLVGLAYGSFGAPCLWGSVHFVWALSWMVLAARWKSLHPDCIQEMHERLGDPNALAIAGSSLQ